MTPSVIASEAKQSMVPQRKRVLLPPSLFELRRTSRRFRLRSLSFGGEAAPRNDELLGII
jgi:hypothetical protein